jgi:glucan phosphoethanolaminetransferase (alkaline phosphatase superfamily)
MELVDSLYEVYTRDKRRCMFIGQLLFVHGLFTAGWFVLMIMFELSKTNVEDIIFVAMLVAAYIIGILYKSMKKKVKNSWTEYNKEKNRINRLKNLKVKDEKDVETVAD